tara:strand:+ start:1421 stop:1642 length:222 start_codon:yes stop_codon:yes gene_type:complete
MALKKAQRGGSAVKRGRPITAKKAAKKTAKGKGYISKPIPNTQKSPGVYVKTKPSKKTGWSKAVGKPRAIKKK